MSNENIILFSKLIKSYQNSGVSPRYVEAHSRDVEAHPGAAVESGGSFWSYGGSN
jgi:hypothetical protein